jgi:hypothetical protein
MHRQSTPERCLFRIFLTALLLGLFFLTPAFAHQARNAMSSSIHVIRLTYHGWSNCLQISNGIVEATVVPAVGRVMQFRFAGGEPVLWENREWFGKAPDPSSQRWQNFGGDKSWPSPQSDWMKITGRDWPPPVAFDSMPDEAKVDGNAVVLTSSIDPHFGMRERRRVELEPGSPVMRITTTYEKIKGEPIKVGIGVITQLRDPQRAFMKLNPHSRFPQGYDHLMFDPPQDVKAGDGMVSLVRGHDKESQVGSDGGALLWMNEHYALRIESPRVPGGAYADHGCNTIIFTSKDPFAYVELETFGPLKTLREGDHIERTNVYTLFPRSIQDPFAEARKLLP